MNKDMFELEELLKERRIPFYFNYRDENRPVPFGEANAEPEDEFLYIAVGPITTTGFEAIVVSPESKEEEALLNVRLSETRIWHHHLASDAACEIINDEFLKRRAEWWPEVYENKQPISYL